MGDRERLQRQTAQSDQAEGDTRATGRSSDVNEQIRRALHWSSRPNYQEVCRILNGLSVSDMLQKVDSIRSMGHLDRLVAFVPRAGGVFRERLLAVMLAVQGTSGPQFESALSLLPQAQQAEIRRYLQTRAALASILSRPIAPGLQPLLPGTGQPGLPGAGFIPPAPAGQPIADSDIVRSIQRVFSVAVEGVGIERPHGRFNINASGTTVELRKGPVRAGAVLGWTGQMGLTTQIRDLHFSTSLSAERWEMSLSFPSDTPVPPIGQLENVFREGEAALRGIAQATANFKSLKDLEAVQTAVEPHLQPVKDAIEAASGVAGASQQRPGRVGLGVSIVGPGLSPRGAPGAPQGIEGFATITIRF